MGFRFIDDITSADIAVCAYGKNIDEVFLSSCEALLSVMSGDPSSVKPVVFKELNLSNTPEMALLEILQEIVFFKDAENLFLKPEQITAEEDCGMLNVGIVLAGERIEGRHRPALDVKGDYAPAEPET